MDLQRNRGTMPKPPQHQKRKQTNKQKTRYEKKRHQMVSGQRAPCCLPASPPSIFLPLYLPACPACLRVCHMRPASLSVVITGIL